MASHHASAQLLYTVTVNTSALTPGSTYYAEYTLSDGTVLSSSSPSTNNTVVLSAFTLGGGTLGTVQSPFGNASGNMGSTVTLADGDAGGVADFAQGFTPGSALKFNVNMTTVHNSGGIPDVFTMYLLDSGFNPITTNAPVDTPNAFLRVDITGPGLTLGNVQTFANTGIPVPSPVITAIGGGPSNGTPEPGSVTLVLGSVVFASLTALRRRKLAKRN